MDKPRKDKLANLIRVKQVLTNKYDRSKAWRPGDLHKARKYRQQVMNLEAQMQNQDRENLPRYVYRDYNLHQHR